MPELINTFDMPNIAPCMKPDLDAMCDELPIVRETEGNRGITPQNCLELMRCQYRRGKYQGEKVCPWIVQYAENKTFSDQQALGEN